MLADQASHKDTEFLVCTCDVQRPASVKAAMSSAVQEFNVKSIDILVNNAGLALGAPAPFWRQDFDDDGEIQTMLNTNVLGFMAAAHAVLNEGGMYTAGHGTILNVTSTTALEAPPFPGEAVYHASKVAQEGFTNSLRNELCGKSIKVLALRPGVVQGRFHEQRVGEDKNQYNEFMKGIEALVAEDVAEAALFMVTTKERVSVKALDVVPSAQRSLNVMDREWEGRETKH